ncbi:MAG TPA: WD40 repeat domain-containing protein [Gemmataceae bacterium]|nr:WD40 repeat domain-containing protein [Gemmataceae bacterium]
MAACLLCLLQLSQVDAQPPRIDHLGDPLPERAIARLGSTRLGHQDRHLSAAVFSPDSRLLATSGENDGSVHLADATTGKRVRTLPGDEPWANAILAFSANGKYLAASRGSCGCTGPAPRILLWDVVTGKRLRSFAPGHRVSQLGFTDGGKTLLTVSEYGSVFWWDVATGKQLGSWDYLSPAPRRQVDGLALSADGSSLAIILPSPEAEQAPRDRVAVVVWDMATGKERCRVEEPASDAYRDRLTLSSDGKYLALYCPPAEKGAARGPAVYDAATGKLLRRFPARDPLLDEELVRRHGAALADLEFTPDGRSLAISTYHLGVRLWDIATGQAGQLFRLTDDQFYRGSFGPLWMTFSPNGQRMLLSYRCVPWLWEVPTGKLLLPAPGYVENLGFVQFAADGKRLVSGDGHAVPWELVTWDTASWKLQGRSFHYHLARRADPDYLKYGHEHVTITPDHRLFVGLQRDGTLLVRETATDRMVCRLDANKSQLHSNGGIFSPNGRLVALVEANWSVWVFDTTTGKRRCAIPEARLHLQVAFAADDSLLAWCDYNGVIHVNATDTGRELHRFRKLAKRSEREQPNPALAFSPDGRYLASWDRQDLDVILWDLKTGKERCRLPIKRPQELYDGYRVCLAFSPDGRALAVGGAADENDVQIWEVASATVRLELRGHQGRVRGLGFSPDGRLLASASEDSTVLIWNLLTPVKGN